MNHKYNILFICALIISIISCSPDDEGTIVSVPENDRTEQQVVDNVIFTPYRKQYDNDVQVSICSIDVEDSLVKLGIKFNNINENINLTIAQFKMKIFDENKIMHLGVAQEFNLKANSQKILYVYINKIEFDQVNHENTKFKITLL